MELPAGLVTPYDAGVYVYDLTNLEAYYIVRKSVSDSSLKSSAVPKNPTAI